LRRADSPVPVALVDAGTASALRVLVADDNSVNQRVAMRMLERLGCEVLLADDGLAALQAWREEPLDLVLMDVRMPVMDGLEATASIRAEETLRGPSRVPIVGISANSSSEDERQCRAAGMDDFVPKPIKLQGLEKVIAALVGSGSARTARRA
jgi:CheY-like chemotaxis protein